MGRTAATLCACLLPVSLSISMVGCRADLGDLAGGRTRNTSHTLTHDGVERSFHLHVPPGYPGRQRWPLVLALHGGGGRGLGFDRSATDGTLLAEADRQGFVVVFPDGVDRAWNDGRDDPAVASRTRHDDVGFLAALVDALLASHPLDPARVYATGISNGGMMSFRLACDLADRIAAVAPVTANMPTALAGCAPSRPVSVLIVNGTEDPLVPYGGGPITVRFFGVTRDRGEVASTEDSVAFWVAHDRCPSPPRRTSLPDLDPDDGTRVFLVHYAGCDAGTAVARYRIEGGGHTWPGGRQYFPERRIGRVSRDLDASRAILAFFADHPRVR